MVVGGGSRYGGGGGRGGKAAVAAWALWGARVNVDGLTTTSTVCVIGRLISQDLCSIARGGVSSSARLLN